MNDALIKLTPDLWVAARQFHNELGPVTSRMTVIRLSDGRIVIHSPVPAAAELISTVKQLGHPVTALIAPNLFHHQFIADWKWAFPGAKTFCSPGLEKKRSDLNFDEVLGGAAREWIGEIEQMRIEAIPRYGETVFFHRKSGTLIVSDLVFNYTSQQAESDPGAGESLGPHQRLKAATSDPLLLREEIDRILDWPFERIIVSHGVVAESGGRALFRKAFAYLKMT